MKELPTPFCIELSLTMASAFHVSGPGADLTLVDRPQITQATLPRTYHLNQDGGSRVPVIPGSSLRGVTRMALERLARSAGLPVCQGPQPEGMCPHGPAAAARALAETGQPFCLSCRIFGSPWRETAVYFESLVPQDVRLDIRASVAISRRLSSAERQRLYTTEVASMGAEQGVRLKGRIEGTLSEPELEWLTAALRSLTHLGADRARGLGAIEEGSIRLRVRRFQNGRWVEWRPGNGAEG